MMMMILMYTVLHLLGLPYTVHYYSVQYSIWQAQQMQYCVHSYHHHHHTPPAQVAAILYNIYSVCSVSDTSAVHTEYILYSIAGQVECDDDDNCTQYCICWA